MRRIFLFIAILLVISSCSISKRPYFFDHYTVTAPRGKEADSIKPSDIVQAQAAHHTAKAEVFMADAGSVVPEVKHEIRSSRAAVPKAEVRAVTRSTPASAKELRRNLKEVKKELKNKLKAETPGAVKEMDYDLRMAIIFGAVGLTLSLFSGISAAFWVLGVIAIVVGVVFLVRWLLRQ